MTLRAQEGLIGMLDGRDDLGGGGAAAAAAAAEAPAPAAVVTESVETVESGEGVTSATHPALFAMPEPTS